MLNEEPFEPFSFSCPFVVQAKTRIMLSKLLRGLDGLSADGTWIWEPHDEDWIYQGGPTGHLHDVYFNQ
jgi:hypothetical protein